MSKSVAPTALSDLRKHRADEELGSMLVARHQVADQHADECLRVLQTLGEQPPFALEAAVARLASQVRETCLTNLPPCVSPPSPTMPCGH